MNTYEQFVILETAKLLKQAGFDWPCTTICKDLSEEFGIEYLAPTQAVAMRWLREVKNCILELYFSTYIDKYTIKIIRPRIIKDVRSFKIDDNDQFYETYEQASEAGIQKCLKLILEEKK